MRRPPPTSSASTSPAARSRPGLVNAHTHLTLTALSGVVPPAPFPEWLPRLVSAMKPWEIADHEASGVVGAEESLASGVTVVGDIAYGAAEVASASRAGLGGVYYWELLGLPAERGRRAARVPALSRDRRRVRRARRVRPLTALALHERARPAARGARRARSSSACRSRSTSPSPPPRRSCCSTAPDRSPASPRARRTASRRRGTSTVAYLAASACSTASTAVHCCHLERGRHRRCSPTTRAAS